MVSGHETENSLRKTSILRIHFDKNFCVPSKDATHTHTHTHTHAHTHTFYVLKILSSVKKSFFYVLSCFSCEYLNTFLIKENYFSFIYYIYTWIRLCVQPIIDNILGIVIALVSFLNGISTFVGFLMSKQPLQKDSSGTI